MFSRVGSKLKVLVGVTMVSLLPSCGSCSQIVQDILDMLGQTAE